MKQLLDWILLALLALVGCLAVVPASSALAANPDAKSVRRFALLVGANDGGGEREILRYAAPTRRCSARP